ncbi:replication-associated recombination protein A [Syntrophomonas palmitatica]|uniref:replication-associated recombination protein A n=1 Tax=Syntrophomonas palmitatica TaxID=402877 RepID=UPI0006CF5403|nr:replication-associated recombination protein A [Syntrophomonas palmitatica]
MDLFDTNRDKIVNNNAPLAYRMRPRNLDEVVGQKAVARGSVLRRAIEKDQLHSFVLYGPPGTGKTSIARVIASATNSYFDFLPAVTSGVSDIKRTAAEASDRLKYHLQRTILFVDEIHRFNKSQQDVLLPFVEDGTLLLIGATTENPLYELNNALLSRMKIYILEPLDETAITQVVKHALADKERGLGEYNIAIEQESLDWLAAACKGDGRMALNIVETAVNSFLDVDRAKSMTITADMLQMIMSRPMLNYDRSGDYHYDTISAYIKSIRGSDPDAALFWLAVMLEGGEDPKFIARRIIVHAAEDIGLADPYALSIAAAAAQAVDFVGLPEARIPLAEATIYLATAPKSNSSKTAIDQAMNFVRQSKKIQVPKHLADASHSKAGSLLGHGQGYRYPHDYGGYIAQEYMPEEARGSTFYQPGRNGYEIKIAEFLKRIETKK